MPTKSKTPQIDPTTLNPDDLFYSRWVSEVLRGLRGKERTLCYRALQEVHAEYLRREPRLLATSTKNYARIRKALDRYHATEAKARDRFAATLKKLGYPVGATNYPTAYEYSSLSYYQQARQQELKYDLQRDALAFRDKIMAERKPREAKPTKLDPSAEALLTTFRLTLQKALPSGPPQPPTVTEEGALTLRSEPIPTPNPKE